MDGRLVVEDPVHGCGEDRGESIKGGRLAATVALEERINQGFFTGRCDLSNRSITDFGSAATNWPLCYFNGGHSVFKIRANNEWILQYKGVEVSGMLLSLSPSIWGCGEELKAFLGESYQSCLGK